ncbi:MFS transporter [Jeotgalibacillus proteolyticus]|uniref:MFS transporter n=1 Tax=Jeotgalibacillus proteolyticus TaxID=2082395 RepID=A0A2S5GDM2_9BACL|nr:MFS transporter [Jeotgalibacillus proteolyticus]PPA71110.1 MFS transporter [Jeotgalibacillus proteolyticus]
MAMLLLIIIYLAFISLGLPDSVLGAAWPVMQRDLGAPIETAGLLFMSIAGGTIVSSLLSGKVLKRFGTGKVAAFSTFLTAAALTGFFFAPSLGWLFFCAVPLGLGAGAIDAGLNDYVATHYHAHHMSWLHSFWGVGATLGPVIMAQFIAGEPAWRSGYLTIACIQFGLMLILFITLPLWGKVKSKPFAQTEVPKAEKQTASVKPLKIKGVRLALIAFFFYCGVEALVGLWGSSFLVNMKGLKAATAAQWVSFYFAGITAGRFITGFLTFKIRNLILIRSGQALALAGALLLVLPLPMYFSLAGFVLIGLGLAPIFPSMLHETPARFGKEHSQTIMGYQMAVAYTGSTFLPPLFGVIAAQTTIGLFPIVTFLFVAVMALSSERLNVVMKRLWKQKEEAVV